MSTETVAIKIASLVLPLVEWGGEVLIGARIETEGVLLKRPATHVLLMDDDIELSPESVKRTYALLRIARDAYRDAFVSGAMMNAEEPDIRIEDTASCPSRAIADPRSPSCV